MTSIRRLVVGLTGATGAVYGVRLLQRARVLGIETHLVATAAGVLNAHHELDLDRKALEAMADHSHAPADVGACIASGSFDVMAMDTGKQITHHASYPRTARKD